MFKLWRKVDSQHLAIFIEFNSAIKKKKEKKRERGFCPDNTIVNL